MGNKRIDVTYVTQFRHYYEYGFNERTPTDDARLWLAGTAGGWGGFLLFCGRYSDLSLNGK